MEQTTEQPLALQKQNQDWGQIRDIDFNTAKKIEENIGKQFMDMDSMMHNMISNIPRFSSEMEYKLQLKTNTRIYLVFMVIGLLLILSVMLSL